jgi:hypothetical protein
VCQIKWRIQARLGVSPDEFAKWKICKFHMGSPVYLEDNVLVGQLFYTFPYRRWLGPLSSRSMQDLYILSPLLLLANLHKNCDAR